MLWVQSQPLCPWTGGWQSALCLACMHGTGLGQGMEATLETSDMQTACTACRAREQGQAA